LADQQDKILFFPSGVPGLPPELNRFELLSLAPDSPFYFLKSLQDENVGFILINPFFFFPEYEFDLPDEEAEALGLSSLEELAVFCIVNASRGLKYATVNLLAPVVVNVTTGEARQVVLADSRYGLRHPLLVSTFRDVRSLSSQGSLAEVEGEKAGQEKCFGGEAGATGRDQGATSGEVS